ncbi:hypothetical protein, partial [Nocardia amikacinitolerans]|uniref:hypothetical protein n=1 Tax=Nocardia amikacinitolerans TaxID=756689 RepID=UPI001FE5B9FD
MRDRDAFRAAGRAGGEDDVGGVVGRGQRQDLAVGSTGGTELSTRCADLPARCAGLSTRCAVLSTRCAVLSTRCAVLSTRCA